MIGNQTTSFPLDYGILALVGNWLGDTYLNDIHPVLEPILMAAVDELVEMKPDVVGFSIYYISEEPSKWMCRELKRRMPNVKIAVGGPNVHKFMV